MTVMTCIQGKDRRFAKFEASTLSRKGKYEFYSEKGDTKISIWCHRVLKRVCPEQWKFMYEERLIKNITTYIAISDSYKIRLQCYLWWHLSLRIMLFKLHCLQTWWKFYCSQVLKNTQTKLYNDKIKDDYYRPVRTYVLNPKSVTLGELYGEMNPFTLEWKDGLLGIMMRTAVQVSNSNHVVS